MTAFEFSELWALLPLALWAIGGFLAEWLIQRRNTNRRLARRNLKR